MAGAAGADYAASIRALVDAHDVVVFSKTTCGYCADAKTLLREVAKDQDVYILELNTIPDGRQYQDALAAMTGRRTVPNIFIHHKNVGGCDDLYDLHYANKLAALLLSRPT